MFFKNSKFSSIVLLGSLTASSPSLVAQNNCAALDRSHSGEDLILNTDLLLGYTVLFLYGAVLLFVAFCLAKRGYINCSKCVRNYIEYAGRC